MENLLDCSYNYHEMSNRIFIPLEINDSIDTPLTEVDPDIQFYSSVEYIQSTKYDYYLKDKFISIIAGKKLKSQKFVIFYIDIKSLPKHYDELEIYLSSLNFKFYFIAHSETWLDEYKQDLYELPNYTSTNKFRKINKGGGVPIYIDDYLPFKCRHDLEYFDNEMESLFIEIEGGGWNL